MKKITAVNSFKINDLLDDLCTDYLEIRNKGIIILMTIDFANCNYHYSDCYPSFSFQQVDNDYGFSFLYSMYSPNLLIKNKVLTESRTTFELRGIRLIISIQGGMNKFNGVGLLMAIGSMISLLASAMAITDMILLNIHPERANYVLHKYRYVENDHMVEHVDKELLKHLTNLGYY